MPPFGPTRQKTRKIIKYQHLNKENALEKGKRSGVFRPHGSFIYPFSPSTQ
jgi:hypothetical protein